MSRIILDDEQGRIIEQHTNHITEEETNLRCPDCGCAVSVVVRDWKGWIDATFCANCGTETTYLLWK